MTVRLPEELDAQLEAIARARHTSKHAVIIEAAGMFGTDAYPTFEEKAAALISSVAQNHALFDGNMRISLAVAQSRLDLPQIAEVIAAHIRRIDAH